MHFILGISMLLGLSVAVQEVSDYPVSLCTFFVSKEHVIQHNQESAHYVDENDTQHCSNRTNACFVLWVEHPSNSSKTIYAQGCWDNKDQNCKQKECISVRKQSVSYITSFCCCTGDFCNNFITEGYLINPTGLPEDPERGNVFYMSYSEQVIIAIAGTVSILVLFFIIYFFSRIFGTNRNKAIKVPPPTFDLDALQIQEKLIGEGCFGSVHCGSLYNRTVAIKIFQYVHRKYFFNERYIYMLPHMKHPSILEYIGYQERTGKHKRPEYLLVLPLYPQGCLQDYLRERTFDWSKLCKMSLSIACGLSYLHTEIKKDDEHRLSVVHRDLTSTNILIKDDGSCMICDFSFATPVTGSRFFLIGVEAVSPINPLNEVGTLRYKAPEVFEGSVNLRDLELSLKQIDVYALSLILWEIATRCEDLYEGPDVPPYRLPYEVEVGAYATYETMRDVVMQQKTRPHFPVIYEVTNLDIMYLKETIEACWDHDADSRLTVLCLLERLSDLSDLCNRHKADSGDPDSLHSPIMTSNKPHKSLSLNNIPRNDENAKDSDHNICTLERENSQSACTIVTLLPPTTEDSNIEKHMINNSFPPVNNLTISLAMCNSETHV